MANPPINTTEVTNRRGLRFESLDDILKDVEMLARAREVKALGNWSPGGVCQHLALAMNKSIDGFDSQMPWIVRTIIGLGFKRWILASAMSAGHKLPQRAVGELIREDFAWPDGVNNLKAALIRLKNEDKRVPSPFMGKLTKEEWTQFHCRHSELHLSFLQPVR